MHISILGQADGPVTALAVAGDILATCAGRCVAINTGLNSGRLVPNGSWVQPEDVGTLAIAPSGRFLLLRSAAGDAIEVRPTDGGPPLVRLDGDLPGRPTTAAAIAATPQGELLLSSTERNRLQVRRMATGELLHDELVRTPRGFFTAPWSRWQCQDSKTACPSVPRLMAYRSAPLMRRLRVTAGSRLANVSCRLVVTRLMPTSTR